MIELISVIQRSSTGQVIIETEAGSIIKITASDGITLKGFSGYADEQKEDWELHESTFGQRKGFVCLVVPHKMNPGAVWIPLVNCKPDDLVTRSKLPELVTAIRNILQRQLPDDEFDLE